MAPELPAGIVYSIINPRRPHATAKVAIGLTGSIGFINDATPIAAPAINPVKAKTLNAAATSWTRGSLP